MPHQETKVYTFGYDEARQVVPPDPEQRSFTGEAKHEIIANAGVTGMSYVGGQIDELIMTDHETGKQFTISRKGWEEDVRYSAEGYVRVAEIVEGTLNRSPVTIAIN